MNENGICKGKELPIGDMTIPFTEDCSIIEAINNVTIKIIRYTYIVILNSIKSHILKKIK